MMVLGAIVLALLGVGFLAAAVGYFLGHLDARREFAAEVRRRRDVIRIARAPNGRFTARRDSAP